MNFGFVLRLTVSIQALATTASKAATGSPWFVMTSGKIFRVFGIFSQTVPGITDIDGSHSSISSPPIRTVLPILTPTARTRTRFVGSWTKSIDPMSPILNSQALRIWTHRFSILWSQRLVGGGVNVNFVEHDRPLASRERPQMVLCVRRKSDLEGQVASPLPPLSVYHERVA